MTSFIDFLFLRGAGMQVLALVLLFSVPPLPAQGKKTSQRPPRKIHYKTYKDKEILKAVSSGLDWLARHQDMGGKWDSDGFTAHCKGPKCSGLGVKDYDFGLTGLSLLAFLDAGKAAAPGEFAKVVKNGVLFLKVLQNEKGFIGARIGGVPMYDHTISTLALCRAFSADPSLPLKKTIRKALDYISNARNPYAAWRYYPRYENDTSVTG